MYKFLFDLLTDPLGLPIDALYEYVILLVLNFIAYKIAWDASPGGRWGSEIHWSVRIVVFVVLWAITYGVIAAVKWLFENWLLIVSVLGFIVLVTAATVLIAKRFKRKNEVLISKQK